MTTPDTNIRIVCAACIDDRGVMVIAPRHWDATMHELNKHVGIDAHKAEQGFIDQRGAFYSRHEAFIVATQAKQIRKKSGNPNSQELFSEDLY